MFAEEPTITKTIDTPNATIQFIVHPVKIDNSNKNNVETAVDLLVRMENGIKSCVASLNELKSSKWNQLVPGVRQGTQYLKQQASGLFDLAWDHKFKCLATGALGLYLYVFYRVNCVNNYLKQDDLWSSWKKELSMKEMLAIPQKELAESLICKVQAVYISEGNPSNSDESFASFVQFVDIEIKKLRKCLRLSILTSSLKLGTLLPLKFLSWLPYCSWATKLENRGLIPSCVETKEQIEERIEKLVYFKNLFSTWLAEYKLKKLGNEVVTLAPSEQAA